MFSPYFQLKAALHLLLLPQAMAALKQLQVIGGSSHSGNPVIYLKLNDSMQEMNAL